MCISQRDGYDGIYRGKPYYKRAYSLLGNDTSLNKCYKDRRKVKKGSQYASNLNPRRRISAYQAPCFQASFWYDQGVGGGQSRKSIVAPSLK